MSGSKRLAGDEETGLDFCRGVVALVGCDVDSAASGFLASVPPEWQEQRRKRDVGDGEARFHITFLTGPDLQRAAAFVKEGCESGKLQWPENVEMPDGDDLDTVARAAAGLVLSHATGLSWVPIGEGRASHGNDEASFLVVSWPAGDAARSLLGLDVQPFHITLGFKMHDVHGRGKGCESLVQPPSLEAGVALAALARRLVMANVAEGAQRLCDVSLLSADASGDLSIEVAALEVLCLLAGLQSQTDRSEVDMVLHYAERLLLLDQENEIGFRSRAFGLVLMKRYGEALPVLARARELLARIEDPNERVTVGDRLRKCVALCRKKTSADRGDGAQQTFGETDEDRAFEHDFLVGRKQHFPQTLHIKNLGAATKTDRIVDITRRKTFCGSGRKVIVEEKIDGANLGISLDSLYRPRLQNRSHWVDWERDKQFYGLEQWLEQHSATLCSMLERNRHVLFGEWCRCLHSVPYTRLPGPFIAFDIYDHREGKFLSRRAFHTRLRDAVGPKIPAVPHIAHCAFQKIEDVEQLLARNSTFGDGPLEGVYLRLDEETLAPGAEETFLLDRCKLVRGEFRQTVDEDGRWEGRGRNKVDHTCEDYAMQSYVFAIDDTSSGGANVTTSQGKYPSTPHLPFSPGVNSDDVLLSDCAHLLQADVVVTEKLDGGNCCIKGGEVYARTHAQPATHASFSAIKELVRSFPYIPDDLEIFGENMSAVHSISYGNLTSYFYIFAARRGSLWLSWDEVVELASQLGVPTVPVVFQGQFQSPGQLQDYLVRWAKDFSEVGEAVTPEGFVVRRTSSFQDTAFSEHIAKYVRANHLQTDYSWKRTWKKQTLGEKVPDRRTRTLCEGTDASSANNDLQGRLANPRSRHTVQTSSGDVELQRNFSFLLEDVAVSSTPKRKEQIVAMQSLGISLVVTLTEETPLSSAWFAGTEVENMFEPVPNYEPPSVDQTDRILNRISGVAAAGGKVMVHCGGGKGRAGTVAACVLLRYGLDNVSQAVHQERERGVNARLCHMQSDEVIRYLREQRPGSIETKQQENFVRHYASTLWQRASQTVEEQPVLNRSDSVLTQTVTAARAEQEALNLLEAELFESASSSAGVEQEQRKHKFSPQSRAGGGGQKVQKQKKDLDRMRKKVAQRAPKYVVMCGLAGAGKSTFCRTLESSGGWVRVNQDDLKRKGCEDLLASTVPLVRQGKTKVVVDRCNITRRERGEMLDLLHKPLAKEVVCIFFDMPATDCKLRAASREDHPTIRKGGGARIIDEQAKRLERPDASEGFRSVEVVRTFADAEALLRSYGVLFLDDTLEAAGEDAADEKEAAVDGSAEVFAQDEEDVPAAVPEQFLTWLRDSLIQEQSAVDLDTMLACVMPILENASNDPDAVENAMIVLGDLGAPETADNLRMQWQASYGFVDSSSV